VISFPNPTGLEKTALSYCASAEYYLTFSGQFLAKFIREISATTL
jgi:hypothetical protein